MPFPIYITDLPPFEKPDIDESHLALNQHTIAKKVTEASKFINQQRVDFKAALTFVAEKIAGNASFSESSPSVIEEILISLRKIVAFALVQKNSDKTTFTSGQLRKNDVFVTKESKCVPKSQYVRRDLPGHPSHLRLRHKFAMSDSVCIALGRPRRQGSFTS